MTSVDFLSLQSEAICLRTMREIHKNSPTAKLYRNASKAAASARLACSYNKSALTADLEISPLLHYYSLLQTLKTLMFIRDVDYPSGTSVLQHGVSVRRTKKESYSWAFDYVHVYKDGVMQSYAALENHSILAGSRYIVGELLGSLPQMVEHVQLFHHGLERVYPVVHCDMSPVDSLTNRDDDDWYVTRKAATHRGHTVEEWKREYIRTTPKSNDTISHSTQHAQSCLGRPEPDGLMSLPHRGLHPWVLSHNNAIYIRDGRVQPEWLIHFVLLYTLSALSRYNPSEWSDIILWNNESDAYLVRQYLQIYQPMVDRTFVFGSGNTLLSSSRTYVKGGGPGK